jgi:hypothetical protein
VLGLNELHTSPLGYLLALADRRLRDEESRPAVRGILVEDWRLVNQNTPDGPACTKSEQTYANVADSCVGKREGAEEDKSIEKFQRKTKRPRLDLSLGAYVDQPSPKCCSIRKIRHSLNLVNGTLVLYPPTRVPLSLSTARAALRV